jgi:DNA-directed RNA polymerase subunit alpha
VLLSSLPGAAITDVRIHGADHEFSALPNVKEDVVSMILNLKSVRLRLQGDEPMTMTLKVKGEKTVTAKDFETPSQVEVINGDQVIATLTDKSAEIEIDAVVGSGRGYVPVENREKEKHDIGQIAIDAIYTPIKIVNFRVDHVRVEQMTNYDQLFLDITTDGSLTPEEAFQQAVVILADQFMFLKDPSKQPVEAAPAAVEEATEAVAEEPAPKKRKAKEPKSE